MRYVAVTESLQIDLEDERWMCRRCGHDAGSARENYKKGLLVHPRDPREIHPAIVDPERYEYTFAPDPKLCVILEFCCSGCGTLIEAEYTVPGHEPEHDLEFDLDDLRRKVDSLRPGEGPAGSGVGAKKAGAA